ncbi:MAG: CAAX protease [Microcoleaceae cyanobacterium]
MMPEPVANTLFDLIRGAFALNSEAFQQIADLPNVVSALVVVLLAEISLGIGESIVLFINRVKPGRFILSLFVNAVLFTLGFLFLVFSTWLICQLPWSVKVSFSDLVKEFGFSYAPLLFGFLGALPYLGVPILNLLSIWRLLAMVVGFATLAGVGAETAFGYVVIGWIALQVFEKTLGQPIVRLFKQISDRAAGVKLDRGRAGLRNRVQSDLWDVSTPMQKGDPMHQGDRTTLLEVEQLIRSANRSHPEAAQAVAQSIQNITQLEGTGSKPSKPTRKPQNYVIQTVDTNDPVVQLNQSTRNIPHLIKLALSLLAMAILFMVIAILLKPIRNNLFGWLENLPGILLLVFNLVWIGVVAIVFAGLLAPLETLGWWAGWYGDGVNTLGTGIGLQSQSLGQATADADDASEVSHYIVYLDGIGQSGETYTPDVEEFLDALQVSLPPDTKLIQGLMMYSVLNKPLNEDRPLAFFWRLADKMRLANPAALLGVLLNLRNVLIVAVSADKRYGPIYNQGIAQVLYDGLIQEGYQPGSGTSITLIGYSGGGEMSVAAAPYLRRAMGTAIEVISLGGVMSANNNFLKLEHLYHLVGDQDTVEQIGPIIFPGRWKVFPLSYWNRAKRKGKITIFSLGPVGHQVPGGMLDPNAFLLDGRSNLQQTIEVILAILQGEALVTEDSIPRKPSNYSRYKQAEFTHPEFYPIDQTVDLNWYQPIGNWMGRLILPKPEERQKLRGIWIEVHYAPVAYQNLVGQVVKLGWINEPWIKKLVTAVTKDIHFSADAEFSSKYGGLVHPDRLNHWRRVGPLESLAGSRPMDDLIVMLLGEVIVEYTAAVLQGSPATPTLRIASQPMEISGRYYSVVQFIEPTGTEQFRVRHFNKASRQFDGLEEVVMMPQVMADENGCFPSTSRDLEKGALNEQGWYIYGAKNQTGQFVVQSLAPRDLFTVHPQEIVFGGKQGYSYIRNQAWSNIVAQKGKISSVLISPQEVGIQAAIDQWQVGDRALVLHTYGGIGGNKREPAAATPIFFGHFAYGLAEVVQEPLTDELRFEIRYYQIYTHNTDGLVAGVLHWSRYLGDRQFGWVGVRPTCDLLVKLDIFTENYDLNGQKVSPLNSMLRQLQVMTARYRIGDGTGGTYVGPANNCSQDSNRALFASIQSMRQSFKDNPQAAQALFNSGTSQEQRLTQLYQLGKDLESKLQAFGGPRSDWEENEYNLGSTLEDQPLRNLWAGLGSWRTMLPRLASETIVEIFLQYGATVWVLRTNQIGGHDPDIEPIALTRI